MHLTSDKQLLVCVIYMSLVLVLVLGTTGKIGGVRAKLRTL